MPFEGGREGEGGMGTEGGREGGRGSEGGREMGERGRGRNGEGVRLRRGGIQVGHVGAEVTDQFNPGLHHCPTHTRAVHG